jgi:UDP-glucuronate 4-epimerase
MSIWVTGVAGFIGSHVAAALAAKGEDVVGIDMMNDYYDLRLKEYRLANLQYRFPQNFTFKKIDLAERSLVEAAFLQHPPRKVIHLAAQAGVRYSIENPHTYTRNNIEAYLHILEGCRHHRVERLVYASSSSVYGGIKETPFSESMAVDKPISLYAATKKANELMAHTYSHLYGFETVGLRFFTVYGPKGRPDMALWLFTSAILEGRAIKVFNGGKMRRDFTYIDDIVSGVIAATERTLPSSCEVYNLGNHQVEELESMISLIEQSLGQKALRENLPMQPGDVHETYADISKAQRDLGYEPRTTMKEGIPRFVDWYRNEWLSLHGAKK